MTNQSISNVKLGVFVLSGLLFLVLILYMIGRNSNLFGSTYQLKARFSNVQGLVAGNNVRYAGIETGTVKKIEILNDTVVEVTMVIDEKMKNIIRKNSFVTIGTEGLVGNKVINIFPSPDPQLAAEENDLLVTQYAADTDEMLKMLDETNRDIADIAIELKATLQKINQSAAFWSLLSDNSIPMNIKSAALHVRETSALASETGATLNALVMNIKNGEGSIGSLLKDTSYASDIGQMIKSLQQASHETDSITRHIDELVQLITTDIQKGPGPLHSLLYDSLTVAKLNSSLDNIQHGTEKFDQNMEALKHNFLFRGYFKKQDRKADALKKEQRDLKK